MSRVQLVLPFPVVDDEDERQPLTATGSVPGPYEETDLAERPDAVCDAYEHLINDRDTSDVTFLVGTEDPPQAFHGHSCILKVRCPQLFTALTSGMVETSTRTLRVTECSPQSFRQFLSFIYCGRCRVTGIDAVQLYSLGRKYLVPALVQPALARISSTIHKRPAAVLDMLLAMDRHNFEPALAERLIKSAVKSFSALPRPKLLELPSPVFQQIVGSADLKLGEVAVFELVCDWGRAALGSGRVAAASLREAVDPLLPCVRLGVFGAQDILSVLEPCGLFTQDELLDLYRHAADPDVRFSWLRPHQFEKRYVEGGEMVLQLVTRDRIESCDRLGLQSDFFDWERGSPHVLEVKENNRWCDLQFLLTTKFDIPEMGQLWVLSRRHHQAQRPEARIQPERETDFLKDVFREYYSKTAVIGIFMEPAEPIVAFPAGQDRDAILLLFRHYDPASETLHFVGHAVVHIECVASALFPALNRRIGRSPADPLLLFEVVGKQGFGKVDRLVPSKTLRQLELINGDILIFQAPPPSAGRTEDAPPYRFPTVAELLRYSIARHSVA